MSINPHFKSFLDLSDYERRTVFGATAERLNTLPSYIEKDFWVCHVLDALYNAERNGQPRILFKGGTSLSKVHNVIQRFSEDIDITVFYEDLGFAGENDPTKPKLGTNQRKRIIDNINSTARVFIGDELRNTLQVNLHDCYLKVDPDDESGMTLLVEYGSLYEPMSEAYVQPRVKIEGGARSAVAPRSKHKIRPYIMSELEDYELSVPGLITIAAECTFLDKVMILHGWYCGHRDEGRLPNDKDRLSRHYYDVATIMETLIADEAIDNIQLLKDIIKHAELFFKRGWMKLDEVFIDGLKIVPQDKLRKGLERDYNAMQEMLFGDIPPFLSLIERIEELEYRLNEKILSS